MVLLDKLQHEMYWNMANAENAKFTLSDKLQHEMYWNLSETISFPFGFIDKLQHEMYWNQWQNGWRLLHRKR